MPKFSKQDQSTETKLIKHHFARSFIRRILSSTACSTQSYASCTITRCFQLWQRIPHYNKRYITEKVHLLIDFPPFVTCFSVKLSHLHIKPSPPPLPQFTQAFFNRFVTTTSKPHSPLFSLLFTGRFLLALHKMKIRM